LIEGKGSFKIGTSLLPLQKGRGEKNEQWGEKKKRKHGGYLNKGSGHKLGEKGGVGERILLPVSLVLEPEA